jgi:hypothetical protein
MSDFIDQVRSLAETIHPLPEDALESFAAIWQPFEAARKQVLAAAGSDLNEIRIGLSIVPWLTLKLGDVFQFLVAHQERHMVQAGKVAAGINEQETRNIVA